MSRQANCARRLACLLLLLSATACTDDQGPTGPDLRDDETSDPQPPATLATDGNGIFDERAHSFPTADFALLSSSEELQSGRYRFRSSDGELPDVIRNDFVVVAGADGEMIVRRVLEATTQDEELIIETGHAYWHEVIREGTYSLTMPLDGRGNAQFHSTASTSVLSVAASEVDLPPLEATFSNTDVCAWLHEVLALMPGSHDREVCGKEVDVEVAYGVSVAIAGTLDSLRILSGNVRLTGDADVALTVDAGSVSGGRRPVFYPCNLGAYPGCLSTPTGAALIDFLRRYAPSIPEASLPPIRICIPGTPVRIRAGYWSGFRWTPPVWRQCRIDDIGALPTVILPSIQGAATAVRPRLQGEMTIRIVGDGKFTLEVPIPGLGGKTGYQVTNDFKATAALGVFVLFRTTLKNGGGTVRLVFDDTGELTQTWSAQAGWDQDFEITDKSNHAELLELTNPDSVVVRIGMPVKVKLEACIALYACDEPDDPGKPSSPEFQLQILGKELFKGLNLGVEAGIGVSVFEEAIYTREQIHPDSSEIDNWHISLEGGYDLFAKAGVHIPLTGWILPQVPREIGDLWECCRVSMADYWGQGLLEVSTTTTGVDLDTDGYSVIVERADTLPTVMDAGVRRIGDGWAPKVFEERIDPNGTAAFGPPSGFLPCIAAYSDAFIVGNPVWGLSIAGARSLGLNIPTWGVTSACRWLIARYRVVLSDVAANCTVADGAVRDSVWLQQRRFTNPKRDDVRHLTFEIECGPPALQGGMAVVLDSRYHGPDIMPSLLVDGVTAAVFETDTVRLNGLAPGDYQLALRGLRHFCASDPQTATVLADEVVLVTPFVVCAEFEAGPGTVTYSATTTGDGDDLNGYRVTRDGAAAAHLPVNGAAEITGLAASQPAVMQVTDIAGNCQAQGPNPLVITLDESGTPVSVPFAVICSAAGADTLIGEIDATAWPASTATLVTSDGRTLAVNGPKTSELTRLTGTPVRVWGRVSATGINVHGYDLRSQVGEDRWLGIVLQRSDGLWLFGEEAVRLVNPPPGLAELSGNLIWITGQEVEGGVQATLYGVIRGG